MSKRTVIDNDPETSSSRREDRKIQIQNWDRDKGVELARFVGLTLTGSHWKVIDYLRHRYLELGDPESAREIARDLEIAFAEEGGNKYLRELFPGGPVMQGCRIAGLPVPAYSKDTSFGSTY